MAVAELDLSAVATLPHTYKVLLQDTGDKIRNIVLPLQIAGPYKLTIGPFYAADGTTALGAAGQFGFGALSNNDATPAIASSVERYDLRDTTSAEITIPARRAERVDKVWVACGTASAYVAVTLDAVGVL